MSYKDKNKQREADKARQQRRRDKIKAKGVTAEGVTQGVTTLIPASVILLEAIPNYGQPDCQCMHCQTNRANGNRHIINHGAYKQAAELGSCELNRVSLPGDPDYDSTRSGLYLRAPQDATGVPTDTPTTHED